jgi:uncharacterized protein (TIGR02145 family)
MKKIFLLAIILLAFLVYMGCKKDDNNDDGEVKGCNGVTRVYYLEQTYNTVEIGDQCWLKENLNIGKMINSYYEMTDDEVIEKYCYDNDPANCEIYGGLYQWNEMMQYTTTQSVQGICPAGWHIPSAKEWKDCFGNNGGGMKETGTDHWYPPNAYATNSTGFTALPAGLRSIGGNFYNLTFACSPWSSTEGDLGTAWYWRMLYNSSQLYHYNCSKNTGFPVRCLKD